MQTVTITKRDGSKHFVCYDDADVPLVVQHHWFLLRGYATAWVHADGRRTALAMHRLLLGLRPGDRRMGDHINGDRLDNRIENLRIVTPRLNGLNRAAENWIGSSRYRGVSWDPGRGKWMARQQVDRKTKIIGRYDVEEEAAAAVEAFRANHGLPPGY